ncbi:MAG TPA: septal ring lytic transglycosylase RlpA family protein [Steroidobacteraceae bacterium]|jgi:rare lipoprotein A
MLFHGRFIDVRRALRGLCLAVILTACGLPAGADESNSSANSAVPQAAAPAHATTHVHAVTPVEAATPVHAATPAHAAPAHEPVVANPELDLSGHKRLGKASFYAQKFAGRKMADGTIMRPQSDNAASKTLPLGTTAKVTNLETGQSAVVTIHDRGPYIQGRIVDLSPSTAKEIGIDHKNGVAKVEVAPIVVPLPDGRVKLGAAAAEADTSEARNN